MQTRRVTCLSILSLLLSIPVFAIAPVRADGWETPALVGSAGMDVIGFPAEAIDASGNVIAVWVHALAQNAPPTTIWANRFIANKGWGTAGPIQKETAIWSGTPAVAVNKRGVAIAVWGQSDANNTRVGRIWSNMFDPTVGWGNPAPVESNNGRLAVIPVAVIDAMGNAIVVWNEFNSTRGSIWANRFRYGEGWGIPNQIDNSAYGGSDNPEVAMDASGNARVVWQQEGRIWTDSYSSRSGWGVSNAIENQTQVASQTPQLSIDQSGNAMVVWMKDGTYESTIWSNRFVSGHGWGDPTMIQASTDQASGPQIVMMSGGSAEAVWQLESDPRERQTRIWADLFNPERGWGTASLVPTPSTNVTSISDSEHPALSGNGGNEAIVVYMQRRAAQYEIWANRFNEVDGWAAPTRVAGNPSGGMFYPTVAVDQSGAVSSVWYQVNSTEVTVWSNNLIHDPTIIPGLVGALLSKFPLVPFGIGVGGATVSLLIIALILHKRKRGQA